MSDGNAMEQLPLPTSLAEVEAVSGPHLSRHTREGYKTRLTCHDS